jgi:uncharacterized protein YkwD
MRILALLLVAAAVVHVPVSSARAQDDTTTLRRIALERAVVLELNRVRGRHGLQSLNASPTLRSAARSHTKAMLDFGFFGHDSKDGTAFSERIRRFYSSQGWRSWSVGEALMATQGRQTEAARVVDAWMNSPPHREIVLSPSWRDVGIGALYAPLAPREFGNAETVAITADFGLRTGK